MMFPVLDTERLVLRELTEHDAQDVLNCLAFHLGGNPEVMIITALS